MPNSYPAQIMFMMSLLSGLIIAISSNSWFMSWVGLELNLLSFIPMILSKHNLYSSEAALKYFLIQALGSSIMLVSATSLILWTLNPSLLILSSLLLKMGAAPVHFWFLPTMQGLSWLQCLTLMTIQKVAPMIMASYTLIQFNSHLIMMIASFSSSMIGSLSGLNQTLLRKIMGYSSINHMAWMLAAISINMNTWIFYFLVYSVVSSSLLMILNFNQIFQFKQMSLIPHPPSKIMSFLTLFSLGGLPPFLGFLPKLLIIKTLANSHNFLWLSILIMGTLITLFYYLRLSMVSLTFMTPKLKTFQKKPHQTLFLLILPAINFYPMLFPFSTLMYY